MTYDTSDIASHPLVIPAHSSSHLEGPSSDITNTNTTVPFSDDDSSVVPPNATTSIPSSGRRTSTRHTNPFIWLKDYVTKSTRQILPACIFYLLM